MSVDTLQEYTIIEKPAFKVIGVQKRVNNKDVGPIGDLWQKVYKIDMLKRIPHKKEEHQLYGMYSDYDRTFSGDYMLTIGTEVTSVEAVLPEEMVMVSVPAQKYAVFVAQGSFPVCLMETWQKIWNTQGLKRAYKYDFEEYNQDFGKLSNAKIKIYISIE